MADKLLQEFKLYETETGFRIEVNGDKEKLKKMGFGPGAMFKGAMGGGRGRRGGRHRRRMWMRRHGHHHHHGRCGEKHAAASEAETDSAEKAPQA